MYDNNYHGNRGGAYNSHQGASSSSAPADYQPEKPEKIPEDYVDAAAKVMETLGHWNDIKKKYDFTLKTSKLRNILSMASDVYNNETTNKGETLLPGSVAALQKMRVRLIYECGRDELGVKPFVMDSHLLGYLKGIGNSREAFIKFENYLEALVAYHRFYGGRDN